jgi:ribosomal protein S18 acetylase RimI-like enzyme
MTDPVADGRTVRIARPADADALGAINVASWQAAYAGQLPADYLRALSPADRAESWRRTLLADPPIGQVLVVTDGGAIAGYAAIGPNRDADAEPDSAELLAIYLHPDHWHRGLGRLLHEQAVAGLRAAGYRSAILWVLSTNEQARRFYERAGWSADGATKTDTAGGGTITLAEVRYRRDLAS